MDLESNSVTFSFFFSKITLSYFSIAGIFTAIIMPQIFSALIFDYLFSWKRKMINRNNKFNRNRSMHIMFVPMYETQIKKKHICNEKLYLLKKVRYIPHSKKVILYYIKCLLLNLVFDLLVIHRTIQKNTFCVKTNLH